MTARSQTDGLVADISFDNSKQPGVLHAELFCVMRLCELAHTSLTHEANPIESFGTAYVHPPSRTLIPEGRILTIQIA